jgi:hypothetical protein
VSNVINFACEDKPPWASARAAQVSTRPMLGGAGQGRRASARAIGARIGRVTGLAVAVLLGRLAFMPRRLGDHLFTINDAEAYWRGWQIAKAHGNLGRRYRDPLFDALAGCATCRGTGAVGEAPCVPCLGTGRVSAAGVS